MRENPKYFPRRPEAEYWPGVSRKSVPVTPRDTSPEVRTSREHSEPVDDGNLRDTCLRIWYALVRQTSKFSA
jgi:hypothetical protein